MFAGAFVSGTEELKKQIKYTDYSNIVEYMDESALVVFEVQVDNNLLSLFKGGRDEMFSSAPLLGYYFGRSSDLKVLKLIVSGIKNKVPSNLIKSRMRNLYA